MAEYIITTLQKFSWILLVLILVFGWYSPILMFLTFICMLGPIVFSFSYGRAWCGNFCPRSSFSSSILSMISPGKTIPRVFKNNIFRIVMLILLMSLFVANLYQSNGTLVGIGYAFLKMIALTTIIQTTIGVLIHPGTWCTFCPMGTAAYYITKLKGNVSNNIIISNLCTGCGTCRSKCLIDIDIPQYRLEGVVKNEDCMKCRKCIRNCPRKLLS